MWKLFEPLEFMVSLIWHVQHNSRQHTGWFVGIGREKNSELVLTLNILRGHGPYDLECAEQQQAM